MGGNYIKRHIDNELIQWKNSEKRKPLLLRGARQVGKSSTIRELGKTFEYFIEINFDEQLSARGIFNGDLSPHRICEEISLMYQVPVIAGKTLLFLDEIQACIPAISSLRYFYEKFPELHVIAAGSLLEFALQELPSFGVGRVRSLFMYPFSFDEYLRAIQKELLADAIQKASPEKPFSEVIHKEIIQHLLRFILIGGMPEVVAAYAQGSSLLDCQQILDDLILSLYDDFSKYKQQVPTSRLREVFSSVMEQTGKKFVYSHASQTSNHLQIKESVELLELAGIVYPVTHTSGNGIPLAAERNIKIRKYLIFDTGIFQRFLKLNISELLVNEKLEQINKGALAEIFVGLELLKAAPTNNPEQLFYWQREQRGSNAEVDYILQRGMEIIPIEVKSGTKGAMQSMYLFLSEKKTPYGIRCSLENYGVVDSVKIYPLYAVSTIKNSVINI